jgi:DNA polymerase-3 subunit epsilon
MRFVKDIELTILRRTQHTALIDCDLLAKVYINLIDQKEPTLNFQNQDQNMTYRNDSNVTYFKKSYNSDGR